MYAQVEKPKENKVRAVANSVAQKKSNVKQGFGFVDNRPEAVVQRKLREAANNYIAPQKQTTQTGYSNARLVIQKISDEEAGAYLGYTLGGTAPTLYFERGHFTQVHDDQNNVGWHPNKGDRHFIRNINPDMSNYYKTNRGQWSRKLKTRFGAMIERGVMNAEEGQGLMMEGGVFINQENNSETAYLHPSRGRLIRPGTPDFDNQYNEAYARQIVRTGNLAPNEARKAI